MSCGCPVLVSDIPVLHEVCGDAAVYFNPYNPNDIRKTILQFLGSDKDRTRGYETARRFSWTASAKTLINLIKEKFTELHN